MESKKKVSIKEIAGMANVSVSAVSRYLNQGYVSEEKKEAIRQAIEQTGYLPSRQAQNLRAHKSNIVGVIVPRLSSEAIARVVDGISRELHAAGYEMLFADTENDEKREIEYIGLFDKYPVDGIILCGTMYTKMHKIALKKVSVPVVIVGQKFEQYPCVFHDDEGAAKALTQKIIDAGARTIGCLCVTREDQAAGADRLKGYKKALAENGLKFDPRLVVEADFSIESGYEKIEQLFRQAKGVDGVFCATDSIAIGAMRHLAEMGLRVPEDVKVASVGHGRMSRVVTPKLTTAHLFYKTSGMESAKMLINLIEQKEIQEAQHMLEYKIMEGDSTGRKA